VYAHAAWYAVDKTRLLGKDDAHGAGSSWDREVRTEKKTGCTKRPVSGLTIADLGADALCGIIAAEALGLGQDVFRFLARQRGGLAETMAHQGGKGA